MAPKPNEERIRREDVDGLILEPNRVISISLMRRKLALTCEVVAADSLSVSDSPSATAGIRPLSFALARWAACV